MLCITSENSGPLFCPAMLTGLDFMARMPTAPGTNTMLSIGGTAKNKPKSKAKPSTKSTEGNGPRKKSEDLELLECAS